MARRLAKRAEGVVFGMVRRVLLARAEDTTERAHAGSCVVVAPHPDDETLGCGALIARKRAAGTTVTVVIATDGRRSHESAGVSPDRLAEIRRGEVVSACARLGVPGERVLLLGVHDQSIDEHRALVRDLLARILAEQAPVEVYGPSIIDKTLDHRALAAIVREVVADAVPRPVLYEYPVWFWTARSWTWEGGGLLGAALRLARAAIGLRPVVVAAGAHLRAKREALSEHRSQTVNISPETDDAWAVLDEAFVSNFFTGTELFFRIEPAGKGGARA